MSAPIRPEHREGELTCNHGPEAQDEWGCWECACDQGRSSMRLRISSLAANLAARDAEIARLKAERDEACVELLRAQGVKVGATPLSAEYAAAVRALDRARRELKLWFGTVDEKDWGGVAIKATDEAIVLATQALSTPRARAVLEQGETT